MTEMNFNQQRLVSLDALRGFVMFLLWAEERSVTQDF